MRTVFSFLAILALIGVTTGCWTTDFAGNHPGHACYMLRNHGGEHFKIQDYQQLDTYWKRMRTGQLSFATLTADDLPGPTQALQIFEGGQTSCGFGANYYIGHGYMTYDNTDPTFPSTTLTNPMIYYWIENESAAVTWDQWRLTTAGVNSIGQPLSTSSGMAAVNPQGSQYLARVGLDANPFQCNFAGGTFGREFGFDLYGNDGVIDLPRSLGAYQCWTTSPDMGYSTNDQYSSGWNIPMTTNISGNGTIRDRDGKEITSAQDLVAHMISAKWDPRKNVTVSVSLERLSIPALGTLNLQRPVNLDLTSMSGGANLVLNEYMDIAEQLQSFLRRNGIQEGDTIDLSNMTLDFGDFTYTTPADFAVIKPVLSNLDRFIQEGDRPTDGRRGFARDRVRVR